MKCVDIDTIYYIENGIDSVYCIEYGKMDSDCEDCIWESLDINVNFETKDHAQKFLSKKGYERDYDNIYFKRDINEDFTTVARIKNFNKQEYKQMKNEL